LSQSNCPDISVCEKWICVNNAARVRQISWTGRYSILVELKWSRIHEEHHRADTADYGIAIGNLRDASLADLLDGYDPLSNPITRALAEAGPIGLYHLAEQRGVLPGGSDFVDESDLCFHSRRALRPDFPKILLPDECYPGGP
jgi:hypothetical protein